jgi:hypothetical protein
MQCSCVPCSFGNMPQHDVAYCFMAAFDLVSMSRHGNCSPVFHETRHSNLARPHFAGLRCRRATAAGRNGRRPRGCPSRTNCRRNHDRGACSKARRIGRGNADLRRHLAIVGKRIGRLWDSRHCTHLWQCRGSARGIRRGAFARRTFRHARLLWTETTKASWRLSTTWTV